MLLGQRMQRLSELGDDLEFPISFVLRDVQLPLLQLVVLRELQLRLPLRLLFGLLQLPLQLQLQVLTSLLLTHLQCEPVQLQLLLALLLQYGPNQQLPLPPAFFFHARHLSLPTF